MAWMLPNELSGFITTKSSLPTPSTEECFYWPQEKQWVPERLIKKLKAGERKQLQGARAIVQKAVSGGLESPYHCFFLLLSSPSPSFSS